MAATFKNVFLNGVGAAGSAVFGAKDMEFRDQSGQARATIEGTQMMKAFVLSYGNKCQLQVVLKDGKSVQVEGFDKEDLEKVKQLVESQYSVTCDKAEVK
jgi:hypothetical protein